MSDAFIAVFAVAFLKSQTLHTCTPLYAALSGTDYPILFDSPVLSPREDVFVEKFGRTLRRNGEKLTIHGDADAFLASSNAERSGKFDLIAKVVSIDELLELFHYLTGTLYVA